MDSAGTVVITGASSGIGEVYARRLAAKGHKLLLIARRAERLSALAGELRRHHQTCTDVLAADLSVPAEVERAAEAIASLDDLEMLINNAGFGTGVKFSEVDPHRAVGMVEVHNAATVRLTRAAVPPMIARGRGTIINVASLAAFFPMPGSAVYCATKSFLVAFSESLQLELRSSGVRVQALCPGFTYTEFHDAPEFQNFRRSQLPKALWMSAEDVVSESLEALRRSRVIVVPGFTNRVIALSARSGLAPLLLKAYLRLRKKPD